ncbi:hypothetical protein [Enterococcus faecium]|uniref:hypothetical protein n=1 Tax=Enterococcus faecium TaxID=1352 RepID=UPI000DE9887B|nr:hypothetical protein [Enterococcus faecium]RBS54735.1 hypothetical protein EB35_01913 [Enterococcus faecium]
MSKALKWLEAESDRLEKECNENNDPHKTINHSFLEGFNYALLNAQALEQIQLDDNQKVVLEWLEEYYTKSQWPFPFYVLKHAANEMPANIFGFYDDFTMKEEFEVLAAFAQWGLEQEENPNGIN